MDDDIQRLVARDALGLDRLEQDIWQREGAASTAAQASRRLASWQALVLALSVISAGTLGAVTATHAVAPRSTNWFGASVQLAPATLLLGATP